MYHSRMLRAAIVGIGTWGQNLVRSVEGSGRIRFVAGSTRSPARAEEFCRRHGISLFGSYEELLESDDVEAVVLATPHSRHCEEIVAAAKAGKHVFVEKPLGLSLKEAARAGRDRASRLLERQAERLLDEDVLAGLCRGYDLLAVA